MKVLVTGRAGQLGYDVCQVLEERKVSHTGTDVADCDITDPTAVNALFVREKPDAVIHCAAFTAVDRAEDEPELCWAVNADGTRNIAVACRESGAKLLCVSTDYVYPGTGDRPWQVTDSVNPQNVYGRTKLAGELAVQSLLKRCFIVRTSWVFGKNGNNFVKTMLRLAENRDGIGVVADQIGSPTYSADLAVLLCDMIATEQYGIYHATNEGFCSWADFAEEIFRAAGKNVTVKRLSTAEYPTKAIRPLNSRMDRELLDRAGFQKLPEWKNAVQRYIRDVRDKIQ